MRDISIYSNHVINFLSSPIKLDQFKQKESKGREFTDCNFLFVSVGKKLKNTTKTLASLLAYRGTIEYNQNRKRTSTNRGKFLGLE